MTLIRPVISWGQVLGSYLYLLGGVSQTGFQVFQGEARAQVQYYIVERNTAAISYLKATTQVSDNESVHYRQTYGEIPVSHPA